MSVMSEQAIIEELRDLPEDDWSQVLDFIARLKARHAKSPARGSVEAILPFFGAWQMTPEEQADIEQMLYEARHIEEGE